MKEILAKLVEGKDLTKEEAMKAQELILTGQATEAQIACFLTALRMKGETLDEITGLAAVLRNKANTISPKVEDYVDLSAPAETVPIRLIFPQHQRSLWQQLGFRWQNMAIVPFLLKVVPEMC